MNTPGIERNAAPYLHGTETQALLQALQSGQWGHGRATEDFERALAEHLGAPDVVAVASGTAALHLALQCLGVGRGDEVVVPSLTFAASVQAIRATGAHPRFCDVDPTTLSTTPEQVRQALTPDTRAVMPVLYGGRPVDLSPLRDTLAARGVAVVEDAAHAFGSYGVGTSDSGALTCFSFDPIKNLTCGDGGAVVPSCPRQAERLRALRQLGIAVSPSWRDGAPSYQVQGPGLRAHLGALNAAIGTAQLAGFDAVASARRSLWRAYRQDLEVLPQVRMVDVDIARAVPFNCVVRLPQEQRDAVLARLRSRGVGAGVHYPPNHLQPAFARWRRPLPETEEVAGQILSLPFHPHLQAKDARKVVAELGRALS